MSYYATAKSMQVVSPLGPCQRQDRGAERKERIQQIQQIELLHGRVRYMLRGLKGINISLCIEQHRLLIEPTF